MGGILKLPSQLSSVIGKSEIYVEGDLPGDRVRNLAKAFPQIESYVINSSDHIRDSLGFVLGDKIITTQTPLPEGAVVEIIFAVSGGCR